MFAICPLLFMYSTILIATKNLKFVTSSLTSSTVRIGLQSHLLSFS